MEFLHSILQIYIFICCAFTTFFLFGLIRNLRRTLKNKTTEELVSELQQHIKVVYKERVGDVHYLYDKVSNNFIAQGTTEDEMWANAKLTFPKQEFIIEGDNGEAVLVSVKDNK